MKSERIYATAWHHEEGQRTRVECRRVGSFLQIRVVDGQAMGRWHALSRIDVDDIAELARRDFEPND